MAPSSQAEIYRWVDEKGQVHFGDKPGSNDHEVIQQQVGDTSTLAPPAQTDKQEDILDQKTLKDVTEENNPDIQNPAETETEPGAIDDEDLSEHEKQRQKRIQEMEALAEELRTAREQRETKREKEKAELKALREGCARAEQRIDVLQKQIDHYISSRTHRSENRRPEEVKLDSKRQRMDAELKSRQVFIKENCQNL